MDLSKYNNDQQQAILNTQNNLMILATAGAGKTSTIIGKIAYELEEGIVQPYEVCAVTFTNRAADEMRSRLKDLIGDKAKGTTIRTFHSLGVSLLRRFAIEAGLDPTFSIADDNDAKYFIQSSLACDDKDAKRLSAAILAIKERGLSPKSNEARDFFAPYDNIENIYQSYENAKNKENALDFPDLIAQAVTLLKTSSRAQNYCHKRYKLVIVDEYQDSNVMQSRFLKLFAGEKAQIVVVGDDDQSIYAFRGADVKNILSFPEQFENVKKIALLKNYRSTSEILSAASSLISNNAVRYPKDIISALNKHGTKPFYLESYSRYEESKTIADIIKADGDFSSFAVLYRKHRTSTRLKRVLIDRHIPFTVAGGVGVLDNAIVKAAISLLRIIANHKDVTAFRHLIKKSKIGLGNESVKKVIDNAQNCNNDIFLSCMDLANKGFKTSALNVLTSSWAKCEEKAFNPEFGEETLGDIVRATLVNLGIKGAEKPESNDVENDEEDLLGVYVEMINNAEDFFDADLLAIEDRVPTRLDVIQCFIIRSELGDDGGKDKSIGAVTLSTMHAAKGLEFDNVFCIGLEDDLLPGQNDCGEDLEEERRIFYVAMTRARKKLFLCHSEYDGSEAKKFGGLSYSCPSRFLKEISIDDVELYRPEEYKQNISPTVVINWKVGDRLSHQDKGDGIVTSVFKKNDKTVLVVKLDSGLVVKLLGESSTIKHL